MTGKRGPDRSRRGHRPRGVDEVTEAVLDAAAELFQDCDPGSVSLRHIASRAGVNYGLLHRHFGTKADLVAAVLRRHSDRFVPSAGAEGDLLTRLTEMLLHYLGEPTVIRTLSWAAMNDVPPETIVAGFPDVETLMALLESELGEPAAIEFFGVVACLVLGVSAFDRYVLAAAGLEPTEPNQDVLRGAANAVVRHLVASKMSVTSL